MPRVRPRTLRRILLWAAAAVLLVLVVAQLILPGIAVQRLRVRLARSGQVLQVQVDAFPAIELLWGEADRVVIRMGSYTSNPGHLSGLLGQAADVGTLDASARRLQAGPLVLHDATLRKRGNQLTGTATVTESDLRAALPILTSVQPVSASAGQVTLQGTASAFGVSVTLQVVVSAQDGNLVVAPNIPFGGLATITLFSNPAVAVQGVSAQPVPGGLSLTANGMLR
jgi:hypothetical protein